MDKNFRRALFTALVTGGLVVVGAASAYAGDGLPDPTTQEAPETIEGAASADADADAASDEAVSDGAAGVPGEGIVGSVVHVDLAGVVDGTLGAEGLVHDLLDGLLPVDGELPGADPGTEEPGTDEPGTEEPGTDEPGTEQPGTEEPGTPGPEEPDTDEPGTGTDGGILDPGAGDPGVVDPGTGEPGTDEPGDGGPGTGRPGTDGPAAGRPDDDGHGRPGQGWLGTDPRHGAGRPGADAPGTAYPAGGWSGAVTPDVVGAARDAVAGDAPGTDPADAGPADPAEDAEARSGEPAQDTDARDAGVDITWGDKAVVVPTTTYGGAILSDGADAGRLSGTPTGLEGQVAPADVPGETLAQTGPMITGQLALVSLLLGLGLVALRIRRRRSVG
ncbi:hypothetical protein [Promicromonospora sukumoe]